jgi:hypothetical protein
MASMILIIVQKTGALIWARKGGPTTKRDLPDGDSQLAVRTQRSRKDFDHKKRNIITTLLDLTLCIISTKSVSSERVPGFSQSDDGKRDN